MGSMDVIKNSIKKKKKKQSGKRGILTVSLYLNVRMVRLDGCTEIYYQTKNKHRPTQVDPENHDLQQIIMRIQYEA